MLTVDQINAAAYEGVYPEANMTLPERCLFFSLFSLYQQFARGKLSKEQGAERKEAAVKMFRQDMADYEFTNKLLSHHANMWKEIELAGEKYSSERTLEHADAFIQAVYQVGPKARPEESNRQKGEASDNEQWDNPFER